MRTAFLLLFLAALPAAAARLETAVEPRTPRVGDRVTLSVTVVPKEGERDFTPDVPSWEPFELVSASSAGAVHTFTLVPFELDVATIPALTFHYVGADGRARDIQTPEIPLAIQSVLPADAKDIKDLKGALRAAPTPPWVWAALLLTAAAAAGAWAYLRRRKAAAAAAAAPRRPPDAEALAALDDLEALLEGPAKPYYSGLSGVLRAYIENRFGLPALDRTTTEMIPLLKELPLAAEDRLALRELLETADLAKFARFESPIEERRAHRERVRAFVLSTRPHPEPAT